MAFLSQIENKQKKMMADRNRKDNLHERQLEAQREARKGRREPRQTSDKGRTVGVFVPMDIHKRMRAYCDKHGMSLKQLSLHAIEEYLKQRGA